MSHRVEPLADHDLEPLRCGNEELDEWLRRHARTATGQGTRTYLLIDAGDMVVGYFALAPPFLNRHEAPQKLGRGAPRQIPAILLAKLAVAWCGGRCQKAILSSHGVRDGGRRASRHAHHPSSRVDE